jgi:SAM-dependent methyltransferase
MKLNFGCGKRFSENWINIDFHSDDRRVRRVNLLSGFPYPDNSMDAVYSSHVLEHFRRSEGVYLITEAFRVLRKGGILRIVLPDLEGSCGEYLRILSLPEDDEKKKLYSWIIVELVDQMVRTEREGEIGSFIRGLSTDTNDDFRRYILSRTQTGFLDNEALQSITPWQKLGRLTPQKLAAKLTYAYIKLVSALLPRNLRGMVHINTDIGERHRWMYDGYSLKLLFEESGFSQVKRMKHDESAILGFRADLLDEEADGSPYKRNSIYMEGVKP